MFKWLLSHKMIVLVIIAVVATGGVVYARGKTQTQPLRYVLSPVTRGSLIVSLQASGQVSAENQLDVKPKVSGTITSLLVKAGDTVAENTPLAQVESKDAERAVRDANQAVADARVSLQSAQLSFNKLKEPPDALSLLQSQNSVRSAERALADLKTGPDVHDLAQAQTELETQQENIKISTDGTTPVIVRRVYDDAVAMLKTTAQSLQQIMYDTESALGVRNGMIDDMNSKMVLDSNALAKANASYYAAKVAVDRLKTNVTALSGTNASTVAVDAQLVEAQKTLIIMEPFIQATYDVLVNTLPSTSRTAAEISSLRNTIQADRSTIASKATAIIDQNQSLEDARKSYVSAQASVAKAQTSLDKLKEGPTASELASAEERLAEAKQSLAKLQEGPEQIDLLVSQNTIEQRRASLSSAQSKLGDAQTALGDYTIRAPFAGLIAKMTVQKGDEASPSTVLATLLTDAKVAQLTLNEVDAAKVQVGQKATLTFDAVSDLTIAGVVSEVDTIGTVSQGVVNYTIKILFQTQDERVKPGMSVSASIITNLKSDTLLVPSAAIRRNGTNATVQVLTDADAPSAQAATLGVTSAKGPETRMVELGISNDQSTEIVSGLKEGDEVITRTIDPATQAKLTTQTTTGATNALRGAQTFGGGTTFTGGTGGFTGGTRPPGR